MLGMFPGYGSTVLDTTMPMNEVNQIYLERFAHDAAPFL